MLKVLLMIGIINLIMNGIEVSDEMMKSVPDGWTRQQCLQMIQKISYKEQN